MQNAVRSGMGLLGMHPSASLTHPLHQSGLASQRMPNLLPMDMRPTLLQGAGARFPLLMQQGLLDASLQAQAQARARAPFSQMDLFNRVSSAPADKAEEEPSSSGGDSSQQEGDQDYRFPPPEKPSTGLLRTPPPEHMEPLGAASAGAGGGAGGGSGGGGRPALLQTPVSQPARNSLVGRLQALAGFTPDSRWSQTRGDFDERDSMQRGQQAGGSKGFQQEERPSPGQNFPSRFESRAGGTAVSGAGGATGAAGASGSGPAWNRGAPTATATSAATAPFEPEVHQDLDDRRRPWDRIGRAHV